MTTADHTHGMLLRPLVVKSGAGPDDPERCAQALTVASTAVVSGAAVTLWLMGEAVQLAVPGVAAGVVLDKAPALDALLDAVIDGGQVRVCAQCAARRSLDEADLVPGIRVAGAAAYVEQILAPDVQAIVY
jgi:predicted peroxiredoxin